MAKKKSYRRFIRGLNGRLVSSPEFGTKAEADDWYDKEKKLKKLYKGGLSATVEDITFMNYAAKIVRERLKTHGYATHVSDEQRLRDYLLPELGELLLYKITPQKMRRVLKKVTDSGLSPKTRDRVKALASAIFSSALNEDPPLIQFNPVSQIKFSERRQGKSKPTYFPHVKEVEKYLGNAYKLGPKHFCMALLFVTSGPRKSEAIGLQWKDIDFENKTISLSKRIIQANLTIAKGTKGGEAVTRILPMSADLAQALAAWKKVSAFKGDDDYIFYKELSPNRGRFVNPRTLYDWHCECLKGLSRHVTVHGLRHTYGREFVKRGGSIKRLQAVLGHSSISTTSLYSDLADESHGEVANLVTFNVKKEKTKSEK